jgi:hypothetical protein
MKVKGSIFRIITESYNNNAWYTFLVRVAEEDNNRRLPAARRFRVPAASRTAVVLNRGDMDAV